MFNKLKEKNYGGSSTGAIYFLGFVGAVVYYIQNADTFGAGILGFLKALVWPAMLIYKALELLNM